MPLAEPRAGDPFGFHLYGDSSDEYTLGDPEAIIWSSIHHLRSFSVAQRIAGKVHGISRKRDRDAVSWNLKLYIPQASEFYEAAANAKPTRHR